MFKLSSVLVMYISMLLLTGCQYKEPEETENRVQIQVVGSYIEGMTVCLENDGCKKTDINGMVFFDKKGLYNFKIKDMEVASLLIDKDKTVVSPYKLFDTDPKLAHDAILMIHTFDKGEDPRDSSVLLYLSTYIPNANSLEQFIGDNTVNNTLEYIANGHSNRVDFAANIIYRDCTATTCLRFPLDIPTKNAYARLDEIAAFITLAENKNVILENLDTKYPFGQETLTSFVLGESYRYRFYAKGDKVLVDIYDAASKITDTAELLESVGADTILTSLTQLHIVK